MYSSAKISSNTTGTNDLVSICGDTSVGVYLEKNIGEITLGQENELRMHNIVSVEDLAFLADATIDNFNEFPEAKKSKMKIICRYLNLMSTDISINYDKSISQMNLQIKKREKYEQSKNVFADNSRIDSATKFCTSSGITCRVAPRKTESEEHTHDKVTSILSDEIKGKPLKRHRLIEWWNRHSFSLVVLFLIFLPSILWHCWFFRERIFKLWVKEKNIVTTGMNNRTGTNNRNESKPLIVKKRNAKVSNCFCPQTCDNEVLNRVVGYFQNTGNPFSCRYRINFFMRHYGDSERSACVAIARGYQECKGCHPDKCSLPEGKR